MRWIRWLGVIAVVLMVFCALVLAVGYGLWTAGVSFQAGCERFGAMALPVGPGNIDMQCQFLVDLKSTVMCCTASMALLMAEEIERRQLKDKIFLKKRFYFFNKNKIILSMLISGSHQTVTL